MPKPIRVIIADDHESVRSGVAAILGTDPDIEVIAHAGDGFEAVTATLAHSPDVVLVDLRMPGKDGIWATERIVSDSQARVLVLTTYDSDDLIAQALTAGAHGYLLKTVSGTDLIAAVKNVALNRHVLDPAVAGGVIAGYTRSQAQPAGTTALPGLTDREHDVLNLLAQGLTNPQIARELGLGTTTVKTHVGALYAKSGVTSRVELSRLTHLP